MNPAIRIPCALSALLLMVAALQQVSAAPVARFWLENTITRKTYGPVLNQPGYRFQIETDGFVVLAAQPGQVLFSTYPATQYLGPFDLQPDRIVDLGEKAYAIVQLDAVEAPRIPADVLPAAVLPEPARTPPPAAANRAPEPIPVESWTPGPPATHPVASLWFEPFHSTKYDWSLGRNEGQRASDLELARVGGTFAWGGLEASLGLSFDGEHSDSVMPATNALISRLKLNEGSGLYAAAGYLHRIPLDRHWSAFAGGQFEFRSESYDLTATVFDGTETILVEAATGDPGESAAVPGADPDGEDAGAQPSPAAPEMIEEEVRLERNVAKSVDLQDLALSLRGGITYEADAWGVRLEILLCVWDDTAVDGSVEVLAEDLKLDGSRSHPLTVSAAAWCYVLEGVWTEAKCTFGAETALRLGVGYEW